MQLCWFWFYKLSTYRAFYKINSTFLFMFVAVVFWQILVAFRITFIYVHSVFIQIRFSSHLSWILYGYRKKLGRNPYLPQMIPEKFRNFIRSSMRKISEMAKTPKNRKPGLKIILLEVMMAHCKYAPFDLNSVFFISIGKRWPRYIRLLLYCMMSWGQ